MVGRGSQPHRLSACPAAGWAHCDGFDQAPAVFDIDQKKAALAVVEQIFAPAKVLIWIVRHADHAVLKTHHLPLHTLRLAGAAKRDQRADGFALHRVLQLSTHALRQINQAVARPADNALAGDHHDISLRAALGAEELPAFFFL